MIDILKKFSKPKSLLGVYVGPQLISVAHVKENNIISDFQVARALISDSGEAAASAVPEDVKMVALFNEEFRKHDIGERRAALAVSGRDIIIRTFEIPMIPREELPNAINFEAKKHLPFKLEELVFDNQVIFDKKSKKNLVLVVAIKEDVLKSYFSFCENLQLNMVSIEYSAFSALRLLALSGVKEQGVSAVVSVDVSNTDEMNFIVLEDGFPLFSRDIAPVGDVPVEPAVPEGQTQRSVFSLDKFKSELRVSLDFFSRKFPAKKIRNIYFIAADDVRTELEEFVREKELKAEFISLKNIVITGSPVSLQAAKAFGCGLSATVKTNLKINLLSAYHKQKARREAGEQRPAVTLPKFELKLEFKPKMIALGALICAAVYGYGLSQIVPVQQEIKRIINQRETSASAKAGATFAELESAQKDAQKKVSAVRDLLKNKMYVVEFLNAIPRHLPNGLWLTDIMFSKEQTVAYFNFKLHGYAYFADRDNEIKEINSFVSKLSSDPKIAKMVKGVSLESIDTETINNTLVTVFEIVNKR